ncbi:MAG TPA: DUF1097 domain-containing protein [Croceibacterium sp.]|jgi:hypothetical protein
MPAYIALALSVGVLAVVDTWLFGLAALVAMSLQVWISFISWGTHFQAGGKATGSITAAACMIWGAIVGMVALILAGGAFSALGTLAAPVAVGLGAALIVLTSKVPYLGIIPIGFFGFACVAAVDLLVKHPDGSTMTPTEAIVPTVISVLIGVAFGFVSEVVTDALTKKGQPSAEQTADPGHA